MLICIYLEFGGEGGGGTTSVHINFFLMKADPMQI